MHKNAQIVLESMSFPDPVIGIAIEPKSQADIDKLSNGLSKLSEEDPTFTVKTDEESRSNYYLWYGRASP